MAEPTPLERAQLMLVQAQAIAARVRENEPVILQLSDDELRAFKADLEATIASADATLSQIKALLDARAGG